MKEHFDRVLDRALTAWVDWARVHARPIAWTCLIATVLLAAYAGAFLGVNMDNISLLDKELPFRKRYAEFAAKFPILDSALIVVIDGETPELTRRATTQLAARLAADPRFTDVFEPGGGAFFERNGLLYLSTEDLEEFADNVTRMQPMLAELMRDGSMANLAQLLRLGLEQARADGGDGTDWSAVLDRVSHAAIAVYDEFPIEVSWESMLLTGTAIDPTTRRVLVLEPVLDFGSLLPASQPMRAIRDAAADLGLDPARGVRVRITGNPALNHEEMLGLAWDIGWSSIATFLIVMGLVYLALRSWRLVTAALGTLLAGLIWTAAFAAATVGYLNVVSICFGVLFIGLGIDYAIHMGMVYADCMRRGIGHAAALRAAAAGTGSSLVLCTLTTAIGFWVFIPTPFRGVAELGLIAGMGVCTSLFLTLTMFPALVSSWLRVEAGQIGRDLRFHGHWGGGPARHPGFIAALALLLAAGALVLLPHSRFDANVVAVRNPATESVQAFEDLLAAKDTSPWNIDLVAPDLASAQQLAARLRQLPSVSRALTLADFVPTDQDEKLEIISELAVLMDVPTAAGTAKASVPVPEQIAALRDLHRFLGTVPLDRKQTKLAASMRLLRDELGRFLARVESGADPAAALATLEQLLLGGVPQQVERLRTALKASPVTLADLPPELVARMRAPSGEARVQVFAKTDLTDHRQFEAFSAEVASVDPNVTGLAVNILEFGHATVDSLTQALISAAVVIALLLWFLWRNLADALLVLAPLALGAMLTGASMVLLDMPYNFVNIIVLPLLLGIGVDSGIHLVHRAKLGVPDEGLLFTTTARAVFFSAVTTMVSFGNLAFSHHRGIASLGLLLVIGLLLMLFTNLVILPALIQLRMQYAGRPAEAAAPEAPGA